ncbi:hypothetical protein ERO13_A07G102300v2 [Gossypium hirsutum]|uniref:Uncharacterized protein n=4 Tax=Gossypium TaxID=3633 RepID=A0A5J5V281_GOSBA|nr:hypothetical protein ES319_A07G111900v1 [Gossypium barbadense]KAG4191568.1 hypothetical protein ERO13_A07G102300v2 [Gossypium hirsutum]TYH09721.1 hypothetical protein ES288_A07G119600v1 [Gossypium darwinii]TYI18806.1 hypothetical protein ES332_A07G118600v1 [Gossypium tomentosum]TYJ26350.1 hypothetical protein E1A91_A07G113800v1 [Gossypium mustelinum]
MDYAIQTLREEFTDIFYRELSFDIYSFVLLKKDVRKQKLELGSLRNRCITLSSITRSLSTTCYCLNGLSY